MKHGRPISYDTVVFGYLGFLRRNECIAKEIVVNIYFLCKNPSVTKELIQFDQIFFKVWCMNASDTTSVLTCGDGHSEMPLFLFNFVNHEIYLYLCKYCVKKASQDQWWATEIVDYLIIYFNNWLPAGCGSPNPSILESHGQGGLSLPITSKAAQGTRVAPFLEVVEYTSRDGMKGYRRPKKHVVFVCGVTECFDMFDTKAQHVFWRLPCLKLTPGSVYWSMNFFGAIYSRDSSWRSRKS